MLYIHQQVSLIQKVVMEPQYPRTQILLCKIQIISEQQGTQMNA